MKYIIAILTILIISACSKKKDASLNTVGSAFAQTDFEEGIDLSSENYSNEALVILENHRSKLKLLLPEILGSEVEIYKNTLKQIENVPVLTLTLEESNELINNIQTEAGVSLIQKEIQINQTYFELFNELSYLNLKYDVKKNIDFVDFYDAGPIVLSDEIMLKIDELVKDEKTRVKLENAKNRNEFAFSVLTIIPGAATSKNILNSVTQAAKYYKTGKILSEKATFVSNLSHKLMNKQVSTLIAKTFKNDKIRTEIANVGYVGLAAGTTKKGISFISPEESNIIYKEIENKINGRIGDFSDGILAVHMQRVRDLIKINSKKILK